MTDTNSESRTALREFISLLQEIDERYLGDEWMANAFGDLPDGFRQIASMLEGGLHLAFELDPDRPFFRRIVTRQRKMMGDNADAIYYTAPIRSGREYRVTGNLAGSVYLSFTVEKDAADGGYSTETAGVLNDDMIDFSPDGDFEIFFGGAPRPRNWLELVEGAGELIVRSDEPLAFAHEYFGAPEKTAEAWRDGWFHTGDRVVRQADGYFRFVDRLKDAIRRRGENISSFEVEQVLLSHAAVANAAAFPFRSELAEDEVMASVILHPGRTLAEADLIAFCEPRLPYFALPRYLEFVSELPSTESGKVQKYKLRERGVTGKTWDREAALGPRKRP